MKKMSRKTIVFTSTNDPLEQEQKVLLEKNQLTPYQSLVINDTHLLTMSGIDYYTEAILKTYENIVVVEGAFLPLAIELAERCGEELANKQQQPLVIFSLVKIKGKWKLF